MRARGLGRRPVVNNGKRGARRSYLSPRPVHAAEVTPVYDINPEGERLYNAGDFRAYMTSAMDETIPGM